MALYVIEFCINLDGKTLGHGLISSDGLLYQLIYPKKYSCIHFPFHHNVAITDKLRISLQNWKMSLTLNEAELDGEFGGDLGDDVGGEVAGDERRVAHHVVHRVGHLHQLAVGEV